MQKICTAEQVRVWTHKTAGNVVNQPCVRVNDFWHNMMARVVSLHIKRGQPSESFHKIINKWILLAYLLQLFRRIEMPNFFLSLFRIVSISLLYADT